MPKKKAVKSRKSEASESVRIRISNRASDRMRRFSEDYGFPWTNVASDVLEWFCSLDEESQLRLVKTSRRLVKDREDVPDEVTLRFDFEDKGAKPATASHSGRKR